MRSGDASGSPTVPTQHRNPKHLRTRSTSKRKRRRGLSPFGRAGGEVLRRRGEMRAGAAEAASRPGRQGRGAGRGGEPATFAKNSIFVAPMYFTVRKLKWNSELIHDTRRAWAGWGQESLSLQAVLPKRLFSRR